MKTALILITALTASNLAFCQETEDSSKYSLVLHGVSQHGKTPNNYDFNERNYGAGLRYELGNNLSVQVGGYRNSYRRTTVYTALNWLPIEAGHVKAGGFAAFVTGYGKQHVGAGALVSIGLPDRSAIEFTYIPKVGKGTTYVGAIQYVKSF